MEQQKLGFDKEINPNEWDWTLVPKTVWEEHVWIGGESLSASGLHECLRYLQDIVHDGLTTLVHKSQIKPYAHVLLSYGVIAEDQYKIAKNDWRIDRSRLKKFKEIYDKIYWDTIMEHQRQERQAPDNETLLPCTSKSGDGRK